MFSDSNLLRTYRDKVQAQQARLRTPQECVTFRPMARPPCQAPCGHHVCDHDEMYIGRDSRCKLYEVQFLVRVFGEEILLQSHRALFYKFLDPTRRVRNYLRPYQECPHAPRGNRHPTGASCISHWTVDVHAAQALDIHWYNMNLEIGFDGMIHRKSLAELIRFFGFLSPVRLLLFFRLTD